MALNGLYCADVILRNIFIHCRIHHTARYVILKTEAILYQGRFHF